MTIIALPSITDGHLHDGLIMKWPQRCHTCTTKECRSHTDDLGLCSYGYNYTAVNKTILAGFICLEHKSSSQAKNKNIRKEKQQIINIHLIENQKASLRLVAIKKNTTLQESKTVARDQFLNQESFKDEFILEIKEDILKGLSFVHDYKQINATISQNINVIIETKHPESE
jgi:hypothetical protein